jgi:hypothetical protein
MTTIKTLAARVLCIFGLHEWDGRRSAGVRPQNYRRYEMTDTEWVLVPKVATPAMLNAANEVMPRITLITSGYAAMLSRFP